MEDQFPTDQNLTGLSWFSCLAEGSEYPIEWQHNYPTLIQQQIRRAYYASVSFTDNNIGQLLATVDELGLTDNLTVVFHADHGYQVGFDPPPPPWCPRVSPVARRANLPPGAAGHGVLTARFCLLAQLGERNIYCKETCFNLATHVPLMIRAPHIPGSIGKRTAEMVEMVDIFPTMAELAGLPPLDPATKREPPLEGSSLVPLLRAAGTRSATPARPAAAFNLSFSQVGNAFSSLVLRLRCPVTAMIPPADTIAEHHVMAPAHSYTNACSTRENAAPTTTLPHNHARTEVGRITLIIGRCLGWPVQFYLLLLQNPPAYASPGGSLPVLTDVQLSPRSTTGCPSARLSAATRAG